MLCRPPYRYTPSPTPLASHFQTSFHYYRASKTNYTKKRIGKRDRELVEGFRRISLNVGIIEGSVRFRAVCSVLIELEYADERSSRMLFGDLSFSQLTGQLIDVKNFKCPPIF
ncbi:hypothetical protein CEXT_751601 [Caerostris extrusa]|uniref:Uncharacterized protein n=1 Tax=Caerostris extrusa TaxID=172846 RepID=A0AAV4NR58_CAEEX|nr:hypothetical protein CEXT_751601 [Caerostris extrusa]